VSRKPLTEEELDALVVRSLSRLPSYAPGRAFGSRVMSRVQLPQPRPVALYRRTRAWVAEPRRAIALAATYAVVATVALAITVPWLVTHSPAIGLAYDWTVARSLGLVREAAIGFAGWAVSSGMAGLVRSVPLSRPQAWAAAFALTAGYAGCAVGLHLLLRAPRGKHAPVQLQA